MLPIVKIISGDYPQVELGEYYTVDTIGNETISLIGIEHPIPKSAAEFVANVPADAPKVNVFYAKRYRLVEEQVVLGNYIGESGLSYIGIWENTPKFILNEYYKCGMLLKNVKQ